ncbi:MAG TPA: hypothetical protein VM388_10925, partial [Acidimicrobiales bacterium]|nr:hypothetical protein [Acidimicrobiales bacterium]
MPRIDIELTSSRPDGTWTWRAAGARQPKGLVSASVLHDGAKVGDVVKAEADFDLDGINVTSVTPPKPKKKPASEEVLPILGSGKEEALVTHSPLKPEREGADRGRRGDRGGRNDRFGGGFGAGGGRGDRGPVGPDGRPLGPGATRPRATPGPGAGGGAGAGPRDGARREGRGTVGAGERERARPDRPERARSERPAGDRPPRDAGARARPPRDAGPGERPPRDGAAGERPPREGVAR